MEISTKSWHYKVATMDGSEDIGNLCLYMQALLTNLFFWIPLILAVIGVLTWFGIIVPSVTIAILLFGEPGFLWEHSIFKPGILILMIYVLLGFIAIFWHLCVYLSDKQSIRMANRPPSLVAEYYRSWKGKYCPTITFIR